MSFIDSKSYKHSSILLLDDDSTEIALISKYLLEGGFLKKQIATSHSIEAANIFLEKNPAFFTLLINLSLFEAGNLESLEQLVKRYPNKIFIVVADKSQQYLGTHLIQLGVDEFILKAHLEYIDLFQNIQLAQERKQRTKQIFRQKIDQALQVNQQLYQSIFNKSKDAIYVCNLEGHLVEYNQATFELFAFSEEELLEIEIHHLFHSEVRKKEFLLTLVRKKAVNDFPIEIEQKNGKYRQCLISASMIQNKEFTGYVGLIRDITEQQKADELRKARDIARASAKMKEQFIANISHEMRTPMNAIWGMSSLLIQTDLSKDQENYINTIKQSSEILLGVVNDILAISELQNSQLKFNYSFFNLYELLHNLMNVLQFKAKEKQLDLSLHLRKEVPKIICGDKVRLNQILYNLIINAIKFTEHGQIGIFIDNINESTNFVQLKFTIKDTGIGIPPDQIEAIFETFTRIRERGNVEEGRGLGLPIAKNLIEQQGGKIGVESEIGKGSNFYFDLLFEIGEEVFPEQIKAKAKATMDKGAIRILLVEDHKMNQLVAIKNLEKYWTDIEITIANNGKEAIDILTDRDFDIILMDIQMPIMNGYEATAFIRHKMPPRKAEIPILAMTAHAHIAKNEKFRDYDMDDCIIKPFEPKELYRKITEYTFKYKVLV